MANVQIDERRQTPVQAEIWFHPVDAESVAGRVNGPRCAFASTVEVSHYLQPLSGDGPPGSARVVIVEPALWEPQSPFLYEARLTLRSPGKSDEPVRLMLGFRRVQFLERGIILNGRAIRLRGGRRSSLSEAEALELRTLGFNLVAAPNTANVDELLDVADQIGLFVLTEPVDEASIVHQEARWRLRPSHLGWFADHRTSGIPTERKVEPLHRSFLELVD